MTSGSPSKKAGVTEQLVAYLDGELDESETASIEKQLRNDPKLRQMAEGLDHAWNMLDALETVSVDEEFSQRTLETIVATGMSGEQQASVSIRQLLSGFLSGRALAWFGLGAIGALCGFSLVLLRGPSEETTGVYRELELLERYPQYSILPHTDALQQLQLPSEETATGEQSP